MNRDTLLGYFLILMAMVSPVALNIVAPIMPVLAQEFGAPGNLVQLSFTAYLAMLAIGQLFGGPLADRYGKRKLLLAGFGLHILGGFVGVVSNSVELLILSRILQAAGGCIGMMLARSILVDMYPSDQAVTKLSYVTMGVAVSQAIAPTLGSVVTDWFGWHAVFYVPMLMAVAVWVAVFVQYPRPIAECNVEKQRSFVATYKALLLNRSYRQLALSSTLIACGFFSFVTCAPFISAQALGSDLTLYGLWFLFVAFGFMAGSYASAKLWSGKKSSRVIIAGHGLAIISALLMLVLISIEVSYHALFLPMALFTFGRGLSQPNLQSLSISAVPVNRASASGLLGFIQLLLGALFAQLAGAAVQVLGATMLPLLLLCYAVTATALYLGYYNKAQRTPDAVSETSQ